MKMIIVFICLFAFVPYNDNSSVIEEQFDPGTMRNSLDFSGILRADTFLTHPAEPIDFDPPGPLTPPRGAGDTYVDLSFSIAGDMLIKRFGTTAVGTFDTGNSYLDDSRIIDLSIKAKGYNYSCENGTILFTFDTTYGILKGIFSPIKLEFRDKKMTIYHSGNSYLGQYRTYTITVYPIME